MCSSDLPAPDAAGIAPSTNPAADLEAALKQAQAQRKSGDFQGAAKTLGQLILFSADDGRVLTEYGKTLVSLGRSDDAISFLERAMQLLPPDWSVYSALGVAYDQKGNYPAARAAYSQALTLKPGEPTVLNNAAMSYMQSGDLESAQRLLQQAAPGTTEFPRISQNMTLVQSLKDRKSTRLNSSH